MSDYSERIINGGTVSLAYEDYARERIQSLTKVCTSPSSNIEQIRGAQLAISELQRLVDLRETLKEQLKRER